MTPTRPIVQVTSIVLVTSIVHVTLLFSEYYIVLVQVACILRLDFICFPSVQVQNTRTLVPSHLLPGSSQNIPSDLCLRNITSHQ
jgi:hypothetical protein